MGKSGVGMFLGDLSVTTVWLLFLGAGDGCSAREVTKHAREPVRVQRAAVAVVPTDGDLFPPEPEETGPQWIAIPARQPRAVGRRIDPP